MVIDETSPKAGGLTLIRFSALVTVKVLSRIFFSFSVFWIGEKPKRAFQEIRLAALLNHTSLFEPLFLGVLPFHALWRIARRGVIPGADITLNRPFAGGFYKLIVPKAVTITRKRDESWDEFLNVVEPDSLILIAPEGRMKRPTGLDKEGKEMNVRGGIADLLCRMEAGYLLLVYSGGLHHIQVPGQRFPRLFQKVRVGFEVLDIARYKADLERLRPQLPFRTALIQDLEERRDRYCFH
jgi:hypothetical protein